MEMLDERCLPYRNIFCAELLLSNATPADVEQSLNIDFASIVYASECSAEIAPQLYYAFFFALNCVYNLEIHCLLPSVSCII